MAVYPTALVTTANIANAGANLSTNPHSDLHDDMRDEIVAVEAELGIAPSGSYSTVKARLDAGWQHIATTTFSAASTVDITIPASTYWEVRILLKIQASALASLHVRVNNDSTAALHRHHFAQLASDAVITTVGADTSWRVGEVNGSTNLTEVNISDANVSSVCPFLAKSAVYGAAESSGRSYVCGGDLAAVRTISSVRFFPSSGTMTGRYVASGYVLP